MAPNRTRAKENEGQPTAELERSQDRTSNERTGQGRAKSPVDALHVEAPTRQKNARGHRSIPQRKR